MMDAPAGSPVPAAWDDEAILALGREAVGQEADTLRRLATDLDDEFPRAVKALFSCRGQVLVTGLGKSGIIARKLAATLTSTGTPSHFIHPVEAVHGDLGIVRGADILISISRSGGNQEVVALHGRCRQFGMTAIAVTGDPASDLATASDIVLTVRIEREACPLDLTPTSSTVAAMAMGDALVVSLLKMRGFRREDFALFHPSGTLGRRLKTTVAQLMHSGQELPVVAATFTLRESLPEIVGKRLGGTCVVDQDGRLAGLCVDGDIKRLLLQREDALDRPVVEAMNERPTTIGPQVLALDALRVMEQRRRGPVTLLIVVDEENRPVGLLHIHDVLRAGLL